MENRKFMKNYVQYCMLSQTAPGCRVASFASHFTFWREDPTILSEVFCSSDRNSYCTLRHYTKSNLCFIVPYVRLIGSWFGWEIDLLHVMSNDFVTHCTYRLIMVVSDYKLPILLVLFSFFVFKTKMELKNWRSSNNVGTDMFLNGRRLLRFVPEPISGTFHSPGETENSHRRAWRNILQSTSLLWHVGRLENINARFALSTLFSFQQKIVSTAEITLSLSHLCSWTFSWQNWITNSRKGSVHDSQIKQINCSHLGGVLETSQRPCRPAPAQKQWKWLGWCMM